MSKIISKFLVSSLQQKKRTFLHKALLVSVLDVSVSLCVLARLDIKVNIIDDIFCSCSMQYFIKILDIFAY